MEMSYLSCLIAASLVTAALPVSANDTSPLYFNSIQPKNDLVGKLEAKVQFAQSQILPSKALEGDRQPILTSLRKSLILVQPLQPDAVTPMFVDARDSSGALLGSVTLAPPSALPETVYHLPGVPAGGVNFTPESGETRVINSSAELAKLDDKNGAFLKERLATSALVEIQTADGRWVRDIYLPQGAELEGKMVRMRSRAGYNSNLYYGERKVTVSNGQTIEFKYANGQWFREGELENNRLSYAPDTWSGELPAEWIVPGLTLSVRQGNLTGELTDIPVGAPGELLLHTIDIGMLVEPRDRFSFAKDFDAQREYFQTLPARRMVVNQYAPLYLPEVMLPNGTLLTDFDPSDGGWHGGTMRQRIGKELISHGIDNANYGINSSAGEGEGSHPFVVAQLAAHNSRGKYANGVQVHGGSGGGGIVTLDNSLGNEFSHEVGHNFGLGHYVDGFRGSVHRSADQINSTWGWDSDKLRFIPNFFPRQNQAETCLDGQCQLPFDGRQFGKDAMAGGEPFSAANRFTLYTPNSAALIQRFFASKAVFDSQSPTGFSKWNADTARMEPYQHTVEGLETVNAPVDNLSAENLAQLLSEYELVKIGMWNGHWARNIYMPAASSENRGRSISIDHRAGYNSHLFINGSEILVSNGYKKTFTSDGQRWQERAEVNTRVARQPQRFEIPVTTLVGYYDPQARLQSYIYPALHAAYGFTYPDDNATVSSNDCQLQVETRDSVLRFKLLNHRASSAVMNKFHINVPSDSQPSKARVVCNNRTLSETALSAAPTDLVYTINGKLPETDGGGECSNAWRAEATYVGGDLASHNGKSWRAEWWTQGEEPGTTGEWGVWRLQGDSDCSGGVTPPPVTGSSDFTLSNLDSRYTLVNGQVSIRLNLTTQNPVQIAASLQQNGQRFGEVSAQVNGNSALTLAVSNASAGSYELVIEGKAEGQLPVVQRHTVTLSEDNQGGGSEGDYPAYVAGNSYQAGDRVSNSGANYECKPWPYSGWCGLSPAHYAPGTGSAWSDAWQRL